jgi:hypothetical protein
MQITIRDLCEIACVPVFLFSAHSSQSQTRQPFADINDMHFGSTLMVAVCDDFTMTYFFKYSKTSLCWTCR